MPNTIWKAGTLAAKAWGDEVIVYNPSSGQSHLLNLIAAQLLALLGEQPLSSHELSAKLADLQDLEPDLEIRSRIEVVLQTLDHLGLIEPVRP